jgi:DNA-binding MarR family transcriptional regulator
MTERTRGGESVTSLILQLLNLHGILYSHGQEITRRFGQTPARWQVLGAIGKGPLTVSQIGRRMGITRQATQRVANILRDEGLTIFIENPDHARSPRIMLTTEGNRILEKINDLQAEWSNEIAANMAIEEIEDARGILDDFKSALSKIEDSFLRKMSRD